MRRIRVVTDFSNKLDQDSECTEKTFGAAALITELTDHLFPTIARRTDNARIWHKHIIKKHVIKVAVARQVKDAFDRDIRVVQINYKLAQTRMEVSLLSLGSHQGDHVVVHVRAT